MAAPITHIVLANKLFDEFFSKFDKHDFLLGTSFPDIRYVTNISRDKTHYKKDGKINIKFSDLAKDNSFVAGAKFHSIVDRVRSDYIITTKVHRLIPRVENVTNSLKFLEDELLHKKFHHWPQLVGEVRHLPYNLIPFNLGKREVNKWYSILQDYFSIGPTPASIKKFVHKELGLDASKTAVLLETMNKIKMNHRIREIVLGMYDNFELLVREYMVQYPH